MTYLLLLGVPVLAAVGILAWTPYAADWLARRIL